MHVCLDKTLDCTLTSTVYFISTDSLYRCSVVGTNRNALMVMMVMMVVLIVIMIMLIVAVQLTRQCLDRRITLPP